MSLRTLSSREFTRDVAAAKQAAAKGAVFITDRGQPTHVLLSVGEYRRMAGQAQGSLLDAMDAIACDEGIDFDPATASLQLKVPNFDDRDDRNEPADGDVALPSAR